MPILEIITIGTELLLGEIQDTNSTYLARTLRDCGIDIYRITTIGDNQSRIASAIKEALNRADIIITTGGLGPTIDDPTRQAVATATNRELQFLPELWHQIEERFDAYGRNPTDNNRRQAYIPKGAIPIHNPVGTAPCFIVEIGNACVISLPGVPPEMKYVLKQSIIPYLSQKYELKSQIIKATVLHTASMGESAIDEIIGDLEKLSNPTVGLLAHPGQIDIRITAKAPSENKAFDLINPLVEELKSRLGENIYGQDDDTLESVISKLSNQHQIRVGILEVGFNSSISRRFARTHSDKIGFETLDIPEASTVSLSTRLTDFCNRIQADICLGVALVSAEGISAQFAIFSPYFHERFTRSYGGPQEYIPLWAENTGLDLLRRYLSKFLEIRETGES